MDLPPPNTTTQARTIGLKRKLDAVVCTIVADDTMVTFTYQRGEHAPHLVESYERTDGFHLHPVLGMLEEIND